MLVMSLSFFINWVSIYIDKVTGCLPQNVHICNGFYLKIDDCDVRIESVLVIGHKI